VISRDPAAGDQQEVLAAARSRRRSLREKPKAAAAAGVDALYVVVPQAVGDGVVGEAGAAVGGDAEAASAVAGAGGGVDAAAAGVDATHAVVAQAVAGGVVGKGERVSQGGRGGGEAESTSSSGQQSGAEADHGFKIFEFLAPPVSSLGVRRPTAAVLRVCRGIGDRLRPTEPHDVWCSHGD